ncbi:MAG TPA: hypothetical protein VGF24_26950 [Vicinamibacterales bacterium]
MSPRKEDDGRRGREGKQVRADQQGKGGGDSGSRGRAGGRSKQRTRPQRGSRNIAHRLDDLKQPDRTARQERRADETSRPVVNPGAGEVRGDHAEGTK